ncbi:peptidase, S9A/B/C family, catalytic domain protein [Peptostreptococcaceae bacterium AS15]|nr:peptidase, S9A/B/C family, catalytic domain protein [Peptostreptococcaceae bacterium AS15]
MKDKIIRDFEKMRFVNNIQKNKAGNKLVFSVASMNYKKNKYDNKLFLYDGDKTSRLKLFNSPVIYKFIDNHHLIYTVKSEKIKKKSYTKIYIQGINSRKYAKSFNIPFEISSFDVVDDRYLVIITSEKIDENIEKEEFKHEITRVNFVENGSAYTYNDISRAYIYDMEENKLKLISNINESVSFINIYGRDIYFITSEKNDVYTPYTKLYIHNIDENSTKALYDKMDFEISEIYKTGEDIITLASDMKSYGINENPKFYKLKGAKLELYCDNEYSLGNSTNSDLRYKISSKTKQIGDSIYFLTTRDDKSSICLLSNQKIEKYFDDVNIVDDFEFLDKDLLICGFDRHNMQELYSYSLKNMAYEIKSKKNVTNFSSKFENAISSYKLDEFRFSSNGDNLKGYVIYPKDFDKNAKYPGVLCIHGGPKTVYSSNFFYEMYLLSRSGYFVFYTNPHGSCGRNNDFADIRGKYGTIDYDDLMNLTNEVLKRYQSIDESRLAVMGGSYGGYMTNHIIGQTNRFKAAITQRSISNWISFYGTSDIGYYFGTDQNACEYEAEKLWDKSPMKNVDKIKTPLLIIHSDEDYRCPLEQALQLFTRLKINKVKSKMLIYKGENHDLSRSGKVQSRVSRLEQILLWLKENL